MSLIYHNQVLQTIHNNIDDRLYELLLEKMNTTEQQLFVQNFKIYLLYGEDDTAFVINFDDIWGWVGFSRKDHAKRLLVNKFCENIHFIYNNKIPLKENPIIKGDNEIILLNVDTFKKFCIKASTKRADEICDYYLKMERIMHQYTKEKIKEMQLNYENTKNKLSKYIENIKVTDDDIFWNDNNVSNYNNKDVIYIGYIGIINNEIIYKFGKSENVYTREFAQHQKTYETFKMKHIEICDNMSFIEKELKKDLKSKNLLRTIEINSKNQTELSTVNDQNNIDKIIKNLKDLIIKYPHMSIKESKDECEKIKNNFETEKIELENKYLKKENEYLKNENNKITKDIEYHKNENNKITQLYEESKQEYKELKIKYKNKKKELLKYTLSLNKNIENSKDDCSVIKADNLTNETSNISNTNEIIIKNKPLDDNDELLDDDNDEMCKTSDIFCSRYIEVGEDVYEDLPEKRFRVQTSALFDLYNQKCLNPLSRPKFNIYLSEKYNITRKNCSWTSYENKQTWCGIKLKNTVVEEKKLNILMKSFIETHCNCGENLYVKTKRFHDVFKDYCNNNNYEAIATNGWSQKKCRIALEKLNFKHEIIGTSKCLYKGIMLK